MDKTIKQIADELGIDKQKVYRFIKKNHINEAHQKSGVMYFDEAVQTLLKSEFSENKPHHEAHQKHINEAVNDTLVEMLKNELRIKNKQIEDLSTALAASQQAAQTAQALHAGTIQAQLSEPPQKKTKSLFKRIFGNGKND